MTKRERFEKFLANEPVDRVLWHFSTILPPSRNGLAV